MRSLPVAFMLLGGLSAAVPMLAQRAGTEPTSADGLEAIYVVRSLRETRSAPSAFCSEARVGFADATFEDQFTLRSTTTRVEDARIVNASVNTIGRLQSCFGATPDPATVKLYAEGVLGSVGFKGRGDCRALKQGFPEPGIDIHTCVLELSDLPSPYLGGFLTSNTVVSRNPIGDKSDPPGYRQPSILTIRLWRRRSSMVGRCSPESPREAVPTTAD